MNKRIPFFFLAAGGLLSSGYASSAPGIDVSAGAGILRLSASGRVDVNNHAGFIPDRWPVGRKGFLEVDQSTQPYLWASVETAAPFIPNLRAEYWRYKDSARPADTLEIGPTDQGLSIENGALTAYYSPVNNWLKLDAGVQLRSLKSRAFVDDLRHSAVIRVLDVAAEATVPAVYGQASFELPLSGLRFGLTFTGLTPGSDKFTEVDARLSWQGHFGGVEVGYRRIDLDLKGRSGSGQEENAHSRFDLQLSGPYLGFTVAL